MPYIFLFFLLLFSPLKHSFASEHYLPPLPHQFSLVQGLQVIDQERWSLGERFISSAAGTLPGQIFYWLKYSSDTQKLHFKWYRISRFIKTHKDWPARSNMLKNAERSMPKDLHQKEVIQWFEAFPPVTDNGKLRYLEALLSSKQKDIFNTKLQDYWQHHLFENNTQKTILSQYEMYLSKEDHRNRLNLLLAHEYYEASIHLAPHIGNKEKSLVLAVQALGKTNKNVDTLINAVPISLQTHPAFIYERIKWRRKKNMNQGAIALLDQAPSLETWDTPYLWWKERHIMIRRLIEESRYEEAYRLASHHKQRKGLGLAEAEFMSGWLALRFVNKPHQAFQHFQTLYRNVKTPISKSRGAYWAGRAALQTGETTKAKEWFQLASYRNTTYYGQRAKEELIQLTHDKSDIKTYPPITLNDEIWEKWIYDDRVMIMRLLHQAGQSEKALQFLIKMLNEKSNTPQDFMTLAKIANLMGFPMGEVKVAKKAAYHSIILTKEDGTHFGYPMLDIETKHTHIGLSDIYAITRQESEFNPKASSTAGAQGYMQLMPKTAKSMAKKLKIKHNKNWLTHHPEHNITLGSAYLESLMTRYDGNLILSAAAYNAGPSNVSKWIKMFGDPRSSDIDPIDWNELIPFSETRNYVQRVSEAEFIYRSHLEN